MDVIASFLGLTLAFPILVGFAFAIWLQDFRSPLYVANRVGKNGRMFKMIKMRSMVVDAAQSGVTSTSNDDDRITKVGRLIRAYKLDEITQLVNVLKGDMSLVGPRPNVMRWGVELYTDDEMLLLSVRPGITDLASIVFSDEGLILAQEENPDLAYNQLIRPWKNRLALISIERRSAALYFRTIWLTLVSIVSRRRGLQGVQRVLRALGVDKDLLRTATRRYPLIPFPPPGASEIITER